VSEPPKPSARVQALLQGSDDDGGLRQIARRETRTRMRALRNLVPEAVVKARSLATCAHVARLPAVIAARVVIGYSAIRREIDPMPLLEAALAEGKLVGLPRVSEDGVLTLLRYRGEALTPDLFGVLAPAADAEVIAPTQVELVLVPALAVDPRGHRLGYGRGFYDRLLSASPAAVSIALVHPFQQVAELADMPGDVPVSWVATEAGVVSARRD
jgi:5-formyltetrahydrofolate cyclo-ligase